MTPGETCQADAMSVVKINAVTVPVGMGADFMERFAKRAGSVENQPGFEEFLLLQPTDGGAASSCSPAGSEGVPRMDDQPGFRRRPRRRQ